MVELCLRPWKVRPLQQLEAGSSNLSRDGGIPPYRLERSGGSGSESSGIRSTAANFRDKILPFKAAQVLPFDFSRAFSTSG